MKKTILKLLFLAICAFSIATHSQATFTGLDKDYAQNMDYLLTNVSKTPITSGILYDRIISFSALNWLKENGTVTNSNYQHFIQSWSELRRSAYSPTFATLETLKTNINANSNPNLVDLGVINTKMHYIDYGTPTRPSLRTANGLLYNVAGINPFLEKQITVIAPLKEKIISGTITFRLLSSFILQLTGLPIKNLVANFDTATNYNLIANTVLSTTDPSVIYSTSGKKTFTFTITFSNNTTETLTASMYVEVPLSTVFLRTTSSFDAEENFIGTVGITTSTVGNIAFQGYNETTATKGELEYRTYYNTVSNPGYSETNKNFSIQPKIRKEIIILDGFDPGDARKIYQGSAGYLQDKSSLYQSMAYDPDDNPSTDNNINLVEKLRSAPYGFDVTLVNFPKGADYIERNAMAVVSLLQRENVKLAANGSAEKISIIGPSMGGLVSRYALAYMEKNNINHNTRLWVSFDSPHLGANIPIAAQENLYFFGYTGQQDKAKIKFDENFRSPAARQMLVEQLDGKHENAPYPTNLWTSTNPNGQNNNSPFRQQFQSNLNANGLSGSNGYPQNLRKIALINGTTNGARTNNAGNKFLELAAFKIIKYGQIFGTPIQTKLKVVTINDSFLQNTGGYGQTFSGKVTIPGFLSITVIDGATSRSNANPRGTMDVVQGGTFDTQGIIKEEFTLELNSQVDSQEWRTYLKNHAFIPSVSALAFKNPNFDWSTALNRNLVCDPNNKEIYFDSYFAPSSNEKHVLVTSENANWLIKELQGIPQAPSFPVNPSALSGLDKMCIGQTSTYSFTDICKIPSAVAWSVSSNLQIMSFTNTSVIVNGLYDGQGVLTATFQNGQTVTKTIWVGKPIVTLPTDCWDANPTTPNCYDICNQTVMTTNNYVYVEAIGLDAVSYQSDSWEWEKITNNFDLSFYQNSAYINPLSYLSPQGYLGYKVRVKNACGWSDWFENYLAVYDCDNGGGQNRYSIFPNPSKDIVNIELTDKTNMPNTKSEITGELFDIMGQSKRKVKIKNNTASLPVAGLAKGIYVLNITIDGKVEGHQVIVE